MRHGVDGRKFGRNTSHRVAMLKNLANNLIREEQIVTTIEKAKETRRSTERLITLAKKNIAGNIESARRIVFARTRDDQVVNKLFGDLAERYKNRAGGYTRIVKISERRWGDAASMCMIELVDHPKLDKKKKPKAENTEAGSDSATKDAVPAGDPFNRFRKLFAGKKTKKEAGSAAKTATSAPAKKVAAPKKTASAKKASAK